jgi:hypothetical protein
MEYIQRLLYRTTVNPKTAANRAKAGFGIGRNLSMLVYTYHVIRDWNREGFWNQGVPLPI